MHVGPRRVDDQRPIAPGRRGDGSNPLAVLPLLQFAIRAVDRLAAVHPFGEVPILARFALGCCVKSQRQACPVKQSAKPNEQKKANETIAKGLFTCPTIGHALLNFAQPIDGIVRFSKLP